MLNSCHGSQSCFLLGKLGTVGIVLNSCNAPTSCLYFTRNRGTVGNVIDSCNGVEACNRGATYGGLMNDVSSSCNAHRACKYAGRGLTHPLHISSNMNNCCNTPYACDWANEASLPETCQVVRASMVGSLFALQPSMSLNKLTFSHVILAAGGVDDKQSTP